MTSVTHILIGPKDRSVKLQMISAQMGDGFAVGEFEAVGPDGAYDTVQIDLQESNLFELARPHRGDAHFVERVTRRLLYVMDVAAIPGGVPCEGRRLTLPSDRKVVVSEVECDLRVDALAAMTVLVADAPAEDDER